MHFSTSKFMLFLAVLSLFLTGCGKQKISQGETTELFNSYTISPSGVLKDDGMHYLHFYDKASASTVYLCNRAGCRHIDQDCGAYFENLMRAFFYQDNLYAITYVPGEDSQIFRADRYGENRALIANIPYPVLQMEISRNELYFFGVLWYEPENHTKSSVGQSVCRLNLDTGVFDELPSPDIGYPNANPDHFTITDDYVYINYTASSIDITDFFDQETGAFHDIVWDEIVYTTLLYRISRNTAEAELLYTSSKTGGSSFGASHVLKENGYALILCSPERIFEYDLQTKEETVLYEPPEEIGTIREIGTDYLISFYSDNRFVLLRDWQEAASFYGQDYGFDTYFGISGNTAYFGGTGNLYAIEYDKLINGIYEFVSIHF